MLFFSSPLFWTYAGPTNNGRLSKLSPVRCWWSHLARKTSVNIKMLRKKNYSRIIFLWKTFRLPILNSMLKNTRGQFSKDTCIWSIPVHLKRRWDLVTTHKHHLKWYGNIEKQTLEDEFIIMFWRKELPKTFRTKKIAQFINVSTNSVSIN